MHNNVSSNNDNSDDDAYSGDVLSLLLFPLDVATGDRGSSDDDHAACSEADVLLAAHARVSAQQPPAHGVAHASVRQEQQQQALQLRSRLCYASASCVAEVERACVALSRCTRASLAHAPSHAWRSSCSHIVCSSSNDDDDDGNSRHAAQRQRLCVVYPVEDGRYMASVAVPDTAVWRRLMGASLVAYLVRVVLQGNDVVLPWHTQQQQQQQHVQTATTATETATTRHGYVSVHTRLTTSAPSRDALHVRMQRKLERVARVLAHVQQQQQRRTRASSTTTSDDNDKDDDSSNDAAALLRRLCVMSPSSMATLADDAAQLHSLVSKLTCRCDTTTTTTTMTDAHEQHYTVAATALWHRGCPVYYRHGSACARDAYADRVYDDYLLPVAIECVVTHLDATTQQQQQQQQQQQKLTQTITCACVALPSPWRRHDKDDDSDSGVVCVAMHNAATSWSLSTLLMPAHDYMLRYNSDNSDNNDNAMHVDAHALLAACSYDAHTRGRRVTVTLPQLLVRARDVLLQAQQRQSSSSLSSSLSTRLPLRYGVHIVDAAMAHIHAQLRQHNDDNNNNIAARRVLQRVTHVYVLRRGVSRDSGVVVIDEACRRCDDVLLLLHTTLPYTTAHDKTMSTSSSSSHDDTAAASRLLAACAPRIAQHVHTCARVVCAHDVSNSNRQHMYDDDNADDDDDMRSSAFALLQSSVCRGVCVCHARPCTRQQAVLYVLLLLPPPSLSPVDVTSSRTATTTTKQQQHVHKDKTKDRHRDSSSSGSVHSDASVLHAASALRDLTTWLLLHASR